MTLAERLAQLEAAAAQPGGLTLRLVDQLTADQPDLRRVLAAAAVPHWWDVSVLSKILDDDLAADAAAWVQRLAALSVVEDFRARPDARNVHEVTRLALRDELHRSGHLAFLSARALAAFPAPVADAPPADHIEHLYHLLLARPEEGAAALESRYGDWRDHGRWAAQLDLAAMLEEVLPLLAPPARARALLRRASIRSDRRPLEEIEDQVTESLQLFRSLTNEHAEAQALSFLAGLAQSHGSLNEARDLYTQCKTIRESLAASDPTHATWQEERAWTELAIGDIAKEQGDLAGALRCFSESKTIAERLAASDPANAAWQRDLSVSLNKLGDLAVAQGDLAGALRSFSQSKIIRERLAASDPANAEWQRDLSVSLVKLGNLAVAQGDLAGALRCFSESKTIAERLAASDPANAAWQRDLWVSYWRLADHCEKSGQAEEAKAWWQKAFDKLSGMKARGLHVSPEDLGFLERLRAKAGEK